MALVSRVFRGSLRRTSRAIRNWKNFGGISPGDGELYANYGGWRRGIRTSTLSRSLCAEMVAEVSDSECESQRYPDLESTKPEEKPRVVVLVTGWAACHFIKGLDTKIYDVMCISPRNHGVHSASRLDLCWNP